MARSSCLRPPVRAIAAAASRPLLITWHKRAAGCTGVNCSVKKLPSCKVTACTRTTVASTPPAPSQVTLRSAASPTLPQHRSPLNKRAVLRVSTARAVTFMLAHSGLPAELHAHVYARQEPCFNPRAARLHFGPALGRLPCARLPPLRFCLNRPPGERRPLVQQAGTHG